MEKLKIILQSKYCYFLLFIFLIFYIYITTIFIHYDTKIKDFSSLEGIITDVTITNDKISFILNSSEKVKCNYYLNGKKEYRNLLGKKVKVYGKKGNLYNNTIPNTFNYKKYLYNHKIYIVYNVSSIEVLEDENIFYKIKNNIINRINKYDKKTQTYLNLFILGDKTYLDDSLYNIYKTNGIWHLFAISGMHIGLIIYVLNKLFHKYKFKNIIISSFLIYFTFLVGFSASVLRAVIFYILNLLNSKYNLELSNLKILFLTAIIILLFNPFMLYNIGFIYSFIITLTILLYSSKITGNYFSKIFKISLLAFIVSLPITINNNYEINLLSIFLNILYVPLISLVIFPIAILTFILSPLSFILNILINILEYLSKIIYTIRLNIIIPKMSNVIIITYYIILFIFYKLQRKTILVFIILIIYLNILLPKLDKNYYIYYLDVNQGDSSILISPHQREVIMIDTGGLVNSDYHISNNTILFLKSLGIKSIDLIIISHGDSDHCKEASYIIDNYKVKNIILNNGNYTTLEKEILKKGNVVNTYDSKYFNYYNINEYYSDDENNSSIITYLNIHNYNFLFMGDAQYDEEEYVLENYNLNNIDVLKVGHHGSNTSSSENFINSINPKYAVISVGRNNLYGHPNQEVLDNLSNSKIYRTDKDGTIRFKINKRLSINTYNP